MKTTKNIIDIAFNVTIFLCITIAVFVILNIFVATSFKVSSNSMSPTIISGDYILVDKISAGARIFNVWKAIKGKNVDIYRIPGWRKFSRNDILAFNQPYVYPQTASMHLDVMKFYVKRCLALPGEIIEMKNNLYTIVSEADSNSCSVIIPQKGMKIKMDEKAYLHYRNLIEWEQKENLNVRNGYFYLNDSIINGYTFKDNYYFVCGDNTDASWDSRYWGMLPEKLIAGRVLATWKSVDNEGKVRWNRVMTRVK